MSATATKPRRALFPVGTVSLALALCAAYAVDVRSRPRVDVGAEELPGLWVLDGAHPKVWQFVSYAFVHAGIDHLLGNLVGLVVASALVERRAGPLSTLLAFVLVSVGASAGFHLGDDRDLYGASGSAAGMMVLAACVWAIARGSRALVRALPAALATLHFAANELLPALRGHPSGGWRAHLSGALAGLVVGAVFVVLVARRSGPSPEGLRERPT